MEVKKSPKRYACIHDGKLIGYAVFEHDVKPTAKMLKSVKDFLLSFDKARRKNK